MKRVRLWQFLFAPMLACCVGCANEKPQDTAQVQGTVTIGGEAIPTDAQGTISFVPTNVVQAGASTATISAGKYDATAVPKGKVLVTFTIMQPTGEEKPFAPGARAQMDVRNLVPSDKAGGVEVEISENNPNLNFDL
jgi:hypothetical protein